MGHAVLSREATSTNKDAVIAGVLEGEKADLAGRFERLSERDQIERMKYFADLLVRLAAATAPVGKISSQEAVNAIATYFRVPTSDVNYGLLYAIRSRRLSDDEFTDAQKIL